MKGHIYFLFYRRKLFYIGQSKNVKKRIYQHLIYHKISAIRVIECDVEKLKHYETRLINYFKPCGNRAHNPANKFKQPKRLPFRNFDDRKPHKSVLNELSTLFKKITTEAPQKT